MDEQIVVGDEEAFETTRLLATREGLFVGMSGGAALVGALCLRKSLTLGRLLSFFPIAGPEPSALPPLSPRSFVQHAG
jgi:cysteine synthase B